MLCLVMWWILNTLRYDTHHFGLEFLVFFIRDKKSSGFHMILRRKLQFSCQRSNKKRTLFYDLITVSTFITENQYMLTQNQFKIKHSLLDMIPFQSDKIIKLFCVTYPFLYGFCTEWQMTHRMDLELFFVVVGSNHPILYRNIVIEIEKLIIQRTRTILISFLKLDIYLYSEFEFNNKKQIPRKRLFTKISLFAHINWHKIISELLAHN